MSLLLSVMLLADGIAPAAAMLTDAPGAAQLTMIDSEGRQITVDESWEETFPYGTFAFASGQLALKEGEGAQTIKVYRLGGAKGKAQLTLSISPVVAQVGDEEYSFTNAAGTRDFILEVEDTLPIADYQAFGEDAAPLAPETPVSISVIDEQSTEDTTGSDGEIVYGNTVLRADVTADAYQWQALDADGIWRDVGDGQPTLTLDNQTVRLTDLRCIFTLDGQRYGTSTLNGEPYVPLDNPSRDIPDDLERNPAQSFHRLDLQDGEYDTYEFYMTFAEGEYVKEVRITPVDDDLAEAVELAALRITANRGGALYDTANTLLISIEDNEPVEPSQVSFRTDVLSVDKAAGVARLVVERTGALQYVTSVDYRTVDGTAKAGEDYAAAQGTLYFSSDIAEMTIEVPLINNGVAVSEEQGDAEFTVVLENAQGGGDQSGILQGTATVRLYNTVEAEEKNLATMLYTPEADDVSGQTQSTASAIVQEQAKVIGATPVEQKADAPVDIVRGGDQQGEAGALQYDASANLALSRNAMPTTTYWDDYADLGGMSDWANTNNVQGLAYQGWMNNPGALRKRNDGFMEYPWQQIWGNNNRYVYWWEQHIEHFDQLFTQTSGDYRSQLGMNWMNTFSSTAYVGISPHGKWSNEEERIGIVVGPPYGTTATGQRSLTFQVKDGATGVFMSMGIEGKDWYDTGAPNGSLAQRVRAQRRYLTQPLRYVVHTADDELIQQSAMLDLYDSIAPRVSVPAGKGGVTAAGQAYVGTQFSLGQPAWTTYSYAETDSTLPSSVYLSNDSLGLRVIDGTVSEDGTANLTLLGQQHANGLITTFAQGAPGNKLTQRADHQYTVNVVLNRKQKIAINVLPSVPRKEDGHTVDADRIEETVSNFWNLAKNATVTWAKVEQGNDTVQFNPQTSPLRDKLTFANTNGMLRSAGTIDNIRSINFHLPHGDQILFNGVQYHGDEDIPVSASMFGMDTLAFTYYREDFLYVENDMTLTISRIERYVDRNGNGQLDGTLDQNNVFQLHAVAGVKDELLGTMTAEEYAITDLMPVLDENGVPQQQFLKFYYNMTPRSLIPLSGGSVDDRVQILPAFVTSVTEPTNWVTLSEEMKGYRYITSGRYSADFSTTNNKGEVMDTKKAGTWSGDNKRMYGAAANATETVDVPLGGDYKGLTPTYVYQKGNSSLQSKMEPTQFIRENPGYELADMVFKREDYKPEYHGNLLYWFDNPEPIFVSESLVGDNLPVADVVRKAGEEGATEDTYNVTQLLNYLGSFNALDTVVLCIRPQEQTTDSILAARGQAVGGGVQVADLASVNAANFKSVPDASGLRRTESSHDGMNRMGDMGDSANPMPEFNLNMGVKLPSLRLGITDYVTLIMGGSEVGFSIGAPVFVKKKSEKSYTESTHGSWDSVDVIDANAGIINNIKDAFTNPGKIINSEAWEHAARAQQAAANGDSVVTSKKIKFDISFNVTVMFKYSPVDNTYHFSSALILMQFGFGFSMTYRLTVCPIVYAYFSIGGNLKTAGKITNKREVVEDTAGAFDPDTAPVGQGSASSDAYQNGRLAYNAVNLYTGTNSDWKVVNDQGASGRKVLTGIKGDAFTITSQSDALNLYFTGKLKVEMKQGDIWKNLGYVASEGSAPVLVMFDEKVDGRAALEVRITVLNETSSFDRAVPISSVRSDTTFDTLTISPFLFMEVGAGVGVESLKVEIFFKAHLSMTMSISPKPQVETMSDAATTSFMGASADIVALDDTVSAMLASDEKQFTFDSMGFRAGFGVRVVFLLFNFELRAIQFGVDYDRTKVGNPSNGFQDNGWRFAWYALNDSFTLETYNLQDIDDSDGFPGVKITLPSNTFTAQQMFGPENAEMVMEQIDALAFDPESLPTNEFQISGYSSSGNAFRLASNLSSGTKHQLLTVGNENYLLYTISRQDAQHTVDSSMLVLSKVQSTGESVGLAHPVTGSTEINRNYLPIDDDKTGDLDFRAEVQDNRIHVVWVNYQSPTGRDGGLREAADDPQQLLADSAHNTALQYASFTVNSGETGFTTPYTLSKDTQSYHFLPAVSRDGKLAFYARTNHYTEEEKAAEQQKAEAYYKASRGDSTTDSNGVSTGQGDPTAAFRYAFETSRNDVYGNNTEFWFAYRLPQGEETASVVTTGFTPAGWEEAGMRLTSISMVDNGDNTFYLAYTATQSEMAVGTNGYGDRNVHKLYLQKGRVNPATGQVTLDTAKMLRQLVDINNMGMGGTLTSGLSTLVGGSGATQDGVYANYGSGAVLVEAVEDPYFGTVRFLTGKLGALRGTEENFGESLAVTPLSADSSVFLLFEMNGATYVVPQDSLKSITEGGTGAVIPFFQPTMEDRTRGGMAIGTDGDGNIAAVYTDTVPNTTNNAIYVSKYDPNTASFGEGRMLAMNHMQVYEDSIAGGWSAEETEQAYHGKLAGYTGGSMSTFVFSDLEVAVGLTKNQPVQSVPSEEGQDIPPATAERSTLLILARGTQTALQEQDYLGENDGDRVVLPKYDESGKLISQTGYYALSFGVGEKTVGEGSITFANPNFTPGTQLLPTISFKNTGDVALRGSASAPITIELWISGQPDNGGVRSAGQRLAQWTVEENIAVGQGVEISPELYTSSLPDQLAGRAIYFTVSETAWSKENPAGVEDALQYSSLTAPGGTTRVIPFRPELAVENLDVQTVGVEGDKVRIAVSMQVSNRGSVDARAPYVQFSRQTGVSDGRDGMTAGQAIYQPMDISSGQFEISNQKPIDLMDTRGDMALGILQLRGADGQDLKAGHVRTVTGTMLIPRSAYHAAVSAGSVNLRVTVFDANAEISTLSATGAQTSSFENEYTGSNNSAFYTLAPVSLFTAPAKITLPLGSTMRLSLPIATAGPKQPVITVNEVVDPAQAAHTPRMGTLYYSTGTAQTGANGYLTLSPEAMGSGIIRVSDVTTNSWTDIAFTVTEPGDGMNIFSDNGIFTWYDAAGKPIDPSKASSSPWNFQQKVMQWGIDGQSAGAPYRFDLAHATVKGASFSFQTLAEALKLHFSGTVRVVSDFPGFVPRTYTANGGDGTDGFAVIELGKNPFNDAHTVTVIADSDNVLFDRVVETFSKGQDILPDLSGDAPQIYLGRSLPKAGTLDPVQLAGKGYPLTVYVLDEGELTKPTLLPGETGAVIQREAMHSAGFYEMEVLVSQNGILTIRAGDTAGNVTTRTVTVDWFSTPATTQASSLPLEVSVDYVDADGQPLKNVGPNPQLAVGQYALIRVDTDSDAEVGVWYYSIAATSIHTEYRLSQEADGWFLIRTVTTTDEVGNVVGEPEITKTPATADTAVPNSSTRQQNTGRWLEIPVHEGAYRADKNGIYRVNSKKGQIESNAIFQMECFNGNLLTVQLEYLPDGLDGENALRYIVLRGKDSISGISRVTINGFSVFAHEPSALATDAPRGVSGMLPIAYGGIYSIVATDEAGNQHTGVLPIHMPVYSLDDAWATAENTYRGKPNGGIIRIDPDKLRGGNYDEALSDPQKNQYTNAYEFAIVKDAAPGAAQTATPLTWQKETVFSGLTAGTYTVYVRDAQAATVDTEYDLARRLTVQDDTVSFTAAAAREAGKTTYGITVRATGGSGQYEFSIIPRRNGNDLLDAAGIQSAIDADGALSWRDRGQSEYVFTERGYGWYQLVVRDKQQKDNLYTRLFSISGSSGGSSTEVSTDSAQLIERNQKEMVVVERENRVVIIPKGTLRQGDSIEDMIVSMPDTVLTPHTAYVVQYAAQDGQSAMQPWSMWIDGRIFYVADRVGKYELVHRPSTLRDIQGHWGEDTLHAAVARGLLQGTDQNLALPDAVMTRGMFVTMLGRLHGVIPAQYNTQSFQDVRPEDWFAPYVEWARQNKIVEGMGNGRFEPQASITREQMSAILYRYAQFSGYNIQAQANLAGFTDAWRISDWAHAQVQWMVASGLMKGHPNGTLDPRGQATRVQATAVLIRLIEHTLREQSGDN